VFARTGKVAVAVIEVWAFQAGFEFWLNARFRHTQPPAGGRLPPAGPVTFVCEWAAAGIPETHASLDAQPILDAAEQSVQLWPEGHH